MTGSEIRKDMLSECPMARLVSGDVGSGKTVCAMAAVYMSFRNGYQSAVMAPTEILARQHYKDFSEVLGKLGIECALLVGSMTKKEKEAVLKKISGGEVMVVVGTHALISENVSFRDLGLTVTDEQHRFGVMQRASLQTKSDSPHVLVMSATPIPRTLALILMGDLDISVIDRMPAGRQKVDTYVIGERHRERLNRFILKQVSEGHQVYIVCPSVEASEDEENIAASTAKQKKNTQVGFFEIKKAKDDRFVFNLYASNKVIIATSQLYTSSQSAYNGIKSVIANAAKANIEDQTIKSYESMPFPKWEIYLDKGNQYRFRLSASNGSCICHSQGYTSKANCKNGIDSIIRTVQDATIDKSYLK